MDTLVSLVFLIILIVTLLSVLRGGPYVPSDKKTIETMLKFIKVKKGEKIVDLGSGDGRIVIELAKRGAIAYGYEINPFLVLWSRFKIWKEGLRGKAFVYCRNLWSVNLSDFDVVVVYAISYVMQDLEKKLIKELKKESRIVSHTFKFPTMKPVKKSGGVYLYKV